MQARGHVIADAVDVDAAVGARKGACLVLGSARDVHVVGRALVMRKELSRKLRRS